MWFILRQSRAPSMGRVQGAGWPGWGSREGRRNQGSQRQHTPFVGEEGNPGSWVPCYASGKMHWLPASGLPPEEALVLLGTAFPSYRAQSMLTSHHLVFTALAGILWSVCIPRWSNSASSRCHCRQWEFFGRAAEGREWFPKSKGRNYPKVQAEETENSF